MAQQGIDRDWEGGWPRVQSVDVSSTQPQPDNDTEEQDVEPSNNEPAPTTHLKVLGGLALGPKDPISWD